MTEGTRRGVLLVNLGTPAAPTPPAVRSYLAEFLGDPRVVDLPRWLWLPILYLFVLTFRPRRSARAYRKVWRDDGSPLLVFSEGLRGKVAARLDGVPVALGMTYGEPSVGQALDALGDVDEVVVLPLYPQNSGTTTGASEDAVARATRGRSLSVRTVPTYATDPGYIAALAASVREAWSDREADTLLLSFHGIPVSYVDKGDRYPEECEATAAALREALDLPAERCLLAYQSRFGPQQWLGPSTEDELRRLGARGGSVDVLCPGFATDCLETLEEIAMEGNETFNAAGGGELRVIPCLNDRDDHADAIATILRPLTLP